MRRALRSAIGVAVGLFGAAIILTAQSPSQGSESLAALKFRFIGPVGNRVIAIAGIPKDPNTWYAGAATGGIWKTVDNGAHWEPIFDAQDVSSIGSLAIAPSDPNIVWAGTGEAFI